MLNYMENDGTIPKREVVTPPDPDLDPDPEVQCFQSRQSFIHVYFLNNFDILNFW